MIITALLDALSGLFSWAIGLMGSISLPDWASDLQSALTTLTAQLAGLGVWVNWPVAVGTGLVVLNVYLACLIVKVVLRIVAFIPMVGGAG